VPDAKIRGKKVRVTCKHCGAGILVDATDEPRHEQLRVAAVDALTAAAVEGQEKAARPSRHLADLSVHDEPTVIGRVPLAALEAERRFSQSTVPPPAGGEAAAPARKPPPADIGERPRALPHDVPEAPLDTTDIASPQAKRQSLVSLSSVSSPQPSAEGSEPPATATVTANEQLSTSNATAAESLPPAEEPPAPAEEPSAPAEEPPAPAEEPSAPAEEPPAPEMAGPAKAAAAPQLTSEVQTMVSRTELPASRPPASRLVPWLVLAAVALIFVLLVMRTTR
jgi:hypothetical protein